MKIQMEKGWVNISNDVFTQIAGAVATNCFGVKGMAVRSKTDGLVHLLRRESMSKGVKVTANEDGSVTIDLLIIVDEVQTGNGRTGRLYAYMHYGFMPDIVSTAKGLAGGLPLGACMLGEKVKDVLTPGSHGSTFGGNPISCAGAVNVLSRIDEDVLAGVTERSEYIISALTGAKGVKSVSGMGLMLGIECEKPAGEVIAACMEKGVLVISAKTKLRLLPALNIPMDELKEAIEILKEVLVQ